MIEQRARVVSLEAGRVMVQMQPSGACNSCDAKGGCGTSLLARWFSRSNPLTLSLSREQFSQSVQIGDQIVLGIPEDLLQRASMLLYAAPLGGLLSGALLGAGLVERGILSMAPDLATLLLGALGFWLGLVFARRGSSVGEHRIETAVTVLSKQPGSIAVTFDPDSLNPHR